MALSTRLWTADTSWRRSPEHGQGRAASATSSRMPRWSATGTQALDGLGHDHADRHRLADAAPLRLDPGQVEQVLDDAAEPLGLGPHPLGQPGHHLRVVLALEGLGQQAEGADRGLQLVADVGDEVAPHGLEPAPLGDVLDDGHGADHGVVFDAAGWRG